MTGSLHELREGFFASSSNNSYFSTLSDPGTSITTSTNSTDAARPSPMQCFRDYGNKNSFRAYALALPDHPTIDSTTNTRTNLMNTWTESTQTDSTTSSYTQTTTHTTDKMTLTIQMTPTFRDWALQLLHTCFISFLSFLIY